MKVMICLLRGQLKNYLSHQSYILHRICAFQSIGSTSKIGPLFCYQKFIYFKTKWKNRSIKVLSIADYDFFPSLRQFSNSISKKWYVFWVDPRIDPFFDFFIRAEMLMSQAMCHRSKQMVVGRSNVWRVRRVE